MADATDIEANLSSPGENGAVVPSQRSSFGVRRALLFAGIAAISVGVAFFAVRSTLRRSPSDPTTERIEALIDEANRLLRELDDQKRA